MGDEATGGVVVAGTPAAARAGAGILEAGGSAADAAIATALALCVSDPANATIAGRTQILWRDAAGTMGAIDGTTRVPARVPARAPPVPLPGLPAALFRLHRERGRLPFSRLVEPARALAAEGFAVTPRLAAAWRRQAPRLARDPVASRVFLDARGQPPAAGARFRQPGLARLLEAMARLSPGRFAELMLRTHPLAAAAATGGGPAPDGELLEGHRFGRAIATVGRQGWGHALLLLLGLLESSGGACDPGDAACLTRLAACVAWAIHDRARAAPRDGPEPDPAVLERLLAPDHLAARLEEVACRRLPPLPRPDGGRRGDTTHLSVIGADGEAVAMTLSAGPHFGSAVADPAFGHLYPLSYRMAAGRPGPGADRTEMTPAMVTGEGGCLLVLGAGGSERIPAAVGLVLWHLMARRLSPGAAVAAPRVVVHGGALRLWEGAPEALVATLRSLGWPAARVVPEGPDHCGIVHLAATDAGGVPDGAADPAWDGRVVVAGDR